MHIAVGGFPDAISFSPDGSRLLAVTWWDGSAILDLSTATKTAALVGHKSETHGGTFSHDGSLAATISIDGMARLWNGTTGALLHELGQETGVRFSDIAAGLRHQDINGAFSPDDRMLATASMYGEVRIWEVETGSLIAVLRGHSGLVEHVAFSPDGTRLLSASHDGTVRLWDVDGVLTTELPHRRAPTFAGFSADGTRLVSGGADRVGHVWDVASGQEFVTLESQGGGPLQTARYSPNGRLVATGSQDGTILVWDAESGREVARLQGDAAAIADLQFSPDGALLGAASVNGLVRLWDVASGVENTFLQASGYFREVLFSPDGKLVLTTLDDNTARLWTRDGAEQQVLAGHENKLSAGAFSPDGRLVATGSVDGSARLWSIDDGSAVATLKGHSEQVTDIAFSPDGQSIVTASRDRTIRIWNVEDGSLHRILSGHEGRLSQAEFTPNGLYIISTSSQDRTVKLWTADSGREIATLTGLAQEDNPEPAVVRAVLNSDGTQIAVVSGEQYAQVIRLFPTLQDLIDYAKTVVPRELTSCERQRFFLPVEGAVGNCAS